MENKTLMEIEGMLTTQARLIALLLGTHLSQGDDPPGNVDKMRAFLDGKLKRDMTASGMAQSAAGAPVLAAALKHLHVIFDLAKAHVSKAPTKH